MRLIKKEKGELEKEAILDYIVEKLDPDVQAKKQKQRQYELNNIPGFTIVLIKPSYFKSPFSAIKLGNNFYTLGAEKRLVENNELLNAHSITTVDIAKIERE